MKPRRAVALVAVLLLAVSAAAALDPAAPARPSRVAVVRGAVVNQTTAAAGPNRLMVRPRQRQLQRQWQREQERRQEQAAAARTAPPPSQPQAEDPLDALEAEEEARAAALAREQRHAFAREAMERDRKATDTRLRWVETHRNEAQRDAHEFAASMADGTNEFVGEERTPAWDYDMPVATRIRAATDAPLLELNYCCCRCGGDNATRDDSDAVFEYAESTDMECEDDWCEEKFALCRADTPGGLFVWNGRTDTMGLRGLQHPSPALIVQRCTDVWKRALEMISVLAVPN